MIQRPWLPMAAFFLLACGDGTNDGMRMLCGVDGDYDAVLTEDSRRECLAADVASCTIVETADGIDGTCDIAVGSCVFEDAGCDRCTGQAMVSSISGAFTFDFLASTVTFDAGAFICTFDLTPM